MWPVLSRTARREQQRGRVPCKLVARRGTDRAVGLTRPLAQSMDALHALEGNKLLQQCSQPVAWAPGTWLVDLVALRAVLIGNW